MSVIFNNKLVKSVVINGKTISNVVYNGKQVYPPDHTLYESTTTIYNTLSTPFNIWLRAELRSPTPIFVLRDDEIVYKQLTTTGNINVDLGSLAVNTSTVVKIVSGKGTIVNYNYNGSKDRSLFNTTGQVFQAGASSLSFQNIVIDDNTDTSNGYLFFGGNAISKLSFASTFTGTTIGPKCFTNLRGSNINISIPTSVKTIGHSAFTYHSAAYNGTITIPETCTSFICPAGGTYCDIYCYAPSSTEKATTSSDKWCSGKVHIKNGMTYAQAQEAYGEHFATESQIIADLA